VLHEGGLGLRCPPRSGYARLFGSGLFGFGLFGSGLFGFGLFGSGLFGFGLFGSGLLGSGF
jgi:hypothetical protein